VAVIFGTQLWSQASPVAIEQSCMSLQRLGVTKQNFGNVPLFRALRKAPLDVVPIGTDVEYSLRLTDLKTGELMATAKFTGGNTGKLIVKL